jgi:peptidoglycan/xylan/chitin deacetylase (PgdA/CDA1 family)
MPRFLVCIHDATPAYERELRQLLGDLAPLLQRRLSVGAVPDWHGQWPLSAHRGFCRMVSESSDEVLLHGYRHHRQHGRGAIGLLAEQSDEMNGLDAAATLQLIERGQRALTGTFGTPARGFLAPAWQQGQFRLDTARALGLDHVLGFFTLESTTRGSVPLATSTWDCGRWGWLGHLGHAIGSVLQTFEERVPVLAIHPRDLTRGFWPKIMRRTRQLIDRGYEPVTASALLEPQC